MALADDRSVEGLVLAWADAVSRGDRAGILAHHASDIRRFDPPHELRGLAAYDRSWDDFYEGQAGPIVFAPGFIEVLGGTEVSLLSCSIHCEGTRAGPFEFRVTMSLVHRSGGWVVTHEHHGPPRTARKRME